MTPRSYHTPPDAGSARVRCPVCREPVYSRAGIHPQCAVRQSDPPKPKGGAGPFPQAAKEGELAAVIEVVDADAASGFVPVP